MEKIYTIQGNVPSKKNSRINTRSGRSFPSKAYRNWHNDAANQLVLQRLVKFTKPVSIQTDFYFENNVRRDIDNRLTSVLDLLVDMEIIKDDRWQDVPELIATGQLDKQDPRVVLRIKEV